LHYQTDSLWFVCSLHPAPPCLPLLPYHKERWYAASLLTAIPAPHPEAACCLALLCVSFHPLTSSGLQSVSPALSASTEIPAPSVAFYFVAPGSTVLSTFRAQSATDVATANPAPLPLPSVLFPFGDKPVPFLWPVLTFLPALKYFRGPALTGVQSRHSFAF